MRRKRNLRRNPWRRKMIMSGMRSDYPDKSVENCEKEKLLFPRGVRGMKLKKRVPVTEKTMKKEHGWGGGYGTVFRPRS
jgi:hypothetical protein